MSKTKFPKGIIAGKQEFGDQLAHITSAKTDYATGDLDTEAETIAALNATNTTLNAVLTALETFGLTAKS